MKRIESFDRIRFVTFSCYQRLPLLHNSRIRDQFLIDLRAVRERFHFNLYGWVIMPEHVHLLLWPKLPEHPLSIVLRELKRGFARMVLSRWRELDAPILSRLRSADGTTRFWQRGGGYDRGVWTGRGEFHEKLRYIHQNPVTRGLIATPTEWRWSSAWAWANKSRWSELSLAPDPLPPKRPEIRG